MPDVIIQQCAAQLVAQSRLLYRKRHSVGKAQAADEYIILPKAYAKVAGNDMIRLLNSRIEQPGAGNFPAALHILREARHLHQRLHKLCPGHKCALALKPVHNALDLQVVERVAHGHTRCAVDEAEIAL